MCAYPKALLGSPLLANLAEEHRDLLLSAARPKSVDKGQVLFNEGDHSEGFYVVSEGSLKLVRYTMQGKEMLVHLVRPGQTFAEASLFGPQTYPASAVALEPSRVWLWPRDKLIYLITCTPELALSLIMSVSIWTRHLVTKLELLTQRRVEERLAVYLLGRAGGSRLASGTEIELTEAKQLIAAQIGTAPEVLSRIFRRLEDAGVLAVQGDKVTITDGERFAMLAEPIEE
jgi:CRP/FNR family transcriptional regulator